MEINDLLSSLNKKEKFSKKKQDKVCIASDWQRQRENHLKTSTNSKSRQKVWSGSCIFLSFYNLLITGFALIAGLRRFPALPNSEPT